MEEIDMKHSRIPLRTIVAVLVVAVSYGTSAVQAERPGWERRQVKWRMSGGTSITAIEYPKGGALPLLTGPSSRNSTGYGKATLPTESSSAFRPTTEGADVGAPEDNTVNSPPIAGFVPWIAVAFTDRGGDEFELDAIPSGFVTGNYLTTSPQTSYGIGIFDTGASAHVIGNTDAARAGLFDPKYLTSSSIDISGVTGTVPAWVSRPVGLFIDGLGAIDPCTMILDDSYMVGETNVSVAVGDPEESPLLPTAIGSPLSVYFAAAILNDVPVTIIRDGNEFTGPDVWFYESYDPGIPDYANSIQLQMRPTGGVAVQYFPNIFDPEDPDWGAPMSPSVITSLLPSQSLFFVSSVDLTNNGRKAEDKSGFMLDTGAQVTVISRAIAARLAINTADPNFLVEITDVTGETIMQPGFYIEKLEIVASPQWLTVTNVPVVMLDVASPEGGTLEGIIGMNLFTDFNLVLHGGGLPDYGGHELFFERIPARLASDIFPVSGDGIVNFRDLGAFAGAWLTTPNSQNWYPKADLAPQTQRDNVINFFDYAVFVEQWLATLP